MEKNVEIGFVNPRRSNLGIKTSQGLYIAQAPLGHGKEKIPVITPDGEVVKLSKDELLALIVQNSGNFVGIKSPLQKDMFEKS